FLFHSLSFSSSSLHLDLHSFPTRRSSDLLPQAAYLAGLPQSPSAYTPFVNTGGLKSEDGLEPGINRMKSVLKRMYDAEFINEDEDRKSTRLNSSHVSISYAVFCLKKKNNI